MDRGADSHAGCGSLHSVLGRRRAIAAAAVLKIVAEGHPGFVLGGFTSNGYVDLSPGHYNLLSCAIIEIVLPFFF